MQTGRTTKVFARDKTGATTRQGVHDACFAIIGTSRTLDLEVDHDNDRSSVSDMERKTRDDWVTAILTVVLGGEAGGGLREDSSFEGKGRG